MRLQANSPTRTKRTPAFCMSVRSASQRDSGHCSGYHAVPSRSAGGVLEDEDCAKPTCVRQSAARLRQTIRQRIRGFRKRLFKILSPGENGEPACGGRRSHSSSAKCGASPAFAPAGSTSVHQLRIADAPVITSKVFD
jgi:hypothetical protein